MGFLWGSAAVSLSCGVAVGLAEAPDRPGRPGTGYPSPADFRILMTTFRVTQCHWSALPTCGNSAPPCRLCRVSRLQTSNAAKRKTANSVPQFAGEQRSLRYKSSAR